MLFYRAIINGELRRKICRLLSGAATVVTAEVPSVGGNLLSTLFKTSNYLLFFSLSLLSLLYPVFLNRSSDAEIADCREN